MEAAINQRLLIAPVTTTNDVSAQRRSWPTASSSRPVDHGGSAAALLPGSAGQALGHPATVVLPKAPALGEHTGVTVLNEPPPRRRHVPIKEPKQNTDRPLEGVKILDFMWVMAGPAATRVLADYGATIVRVEVGTTASTPARTLQPFRDDAGDPELSAPVPQHERRQAGHGHRPAPTRGPRRRLRPASAGPTSSPSRTRPGR